MGAPKSPGRDAYDEELNKLGQLPRFYVDSVRMKRPDFTPERIRRARSGKAVDFEVLEVLNKVSAEYTKILPQLQAA